VSERKQFVLGITGASGAAYSTRLIECLAAAGADVHLVITPYGRQLLLDELGLRSPSKESLGGAHADRVTIHPFRDLGSKLASGSFLTSGMIVCPCSSNTLAQIASGAGNNLLTRAAHVHLKERRPLILVVRESPLSLIEIENMARVTRSGGTVCPASPGFYMMPRTIGDLVDFVVGKVLDLAGVPHPLNTRWSGSQVQAPEAGDAPPSVD
jgi:4-hydroxy-3-polyprenylbenzoate decarboxylase